MAEKKVPPVIDPHVDVAEELARLVGETGSVQTVMGAFRIKIFHTGGFPWAEVFKVLLYRDFKVDVVNEKADLVIQARP